MSRTISRLTSDREGWSLEDVQHIVLDGVSWELYEHLLKEIGDRPIRLTYDNGELEIMSPLYEHEIAKTVIGRLIETLAEEMDVSLAGGGSTTFRWKRRKKGLEPDECYYVASFSLVAGKKRIVLPGDPPPDLAVEIDITSRSIPRLPIYAGLGVPEVWRFDGNVLQCLHLGADGKYQERPFSRSFPKLQPAELVRFIELAVRTGDLTAVAKAFRKWLRSQNWIK